MIKVAGKWGQAGALLRKEEISLAMDEITKAGKSFDVSFISINPREAEAVPGLACRRLPIQIDVRSRYKDFGAFLGSLEKLKKSVVTVRQFAMSRDEAQPSFINSKMLVDVYLKDKE
jgi:Tfp pilus assembly protein PilO